MITACEAPSALLQVDLSAPKNKKQLHNSSSENYRWRHMFYTVYGPCIAFYVYFPPSKFTIKRCNFPNFPWKFFWLFVTLILTEQTPAALVRWQAPMTNDWLAHFQSRLYLRMRRNFTKRAVGIKPEAVSMCSRTVCLQDLNGWYKTYVVRTGEETAFVCLVLHIMQILLSWSYLSE